jgi:UDP-4-amino-4,6-dideoxy-N-acetyl-beta-L-altrosamine N-acetyltransferase
MKIEFRKVDFSDIEKIRKWRNSDLIRNVSFDRSIIDHKKQSKWYDTIKDNIFQLHWIINIDGIDAGYAAIKNIDLINKRCEFSSLYIGEEKFLFNGSGALIEYKIIDYIFTKYPEIIKIYCEVLGFNNKVIQLHKRFGFVIEGELKQHYLLNNKFESVFLLALFRDNWKVNKPILTKILIR